MADTSVWQLAGELKQLVTTGMTRDRLKQRDVILNLPVVRERAGSDSSPDNLASSADRIIRESAASFGDSAEGKAYAVLLALNAKGKIQKVELRRADARKILGDKTLAEDWRRGAEQVFFEELARVILSIPVRASDQPKKANKRRQNPSPKVAKPQPMPSAPLPQRERTKYEAQWDKRLQLAINDLDGSPYTWETRHDHRTVVDQIRSAFKAKSGSVSVEELIGVGFPAPGEREDTSINRDQRLRRLEPVLMATLRSPTGHSRAPFTMQLTRKPARGMALTYQVYFMNPSFRRAGVDAFIVLVRLNHRLAGIRIIVGVGLWKNHNLLPGRRQTKMHLRLSFSTYPRLKNILNAMIDLDVNRLAISGG